MALRLYAATTSAGKLRDFRTAAQAFSVAIEPLPGIAQIPAPEEDGDTFLANAAPRLSIIRASPPARWCWPTTPALKSMRWAALPACAPRVLPPMPAWWTRPTPTTTPTCGTTCCCCRSWMGIPASLRTARYHCGWSLRATARWLQIAEGSVEGLILEAPRGTGGFGYDPLFYLPELGKTMAEIDLETKLSLSHRGRAIAALLPSNSGLNGFPGPCRRIERAAARRYKCRHSQSVLLPGLDIIMWSRSTNEKSKPIDLDL